MVLGTPQQVITCVLYCLRHVHCFINDDSQLTLTQLFLAGTGWYFANLNLKPAGEFCQPKPKPGGECDHRAGVGQPRKMGDHLVIKQQVSSQPDKLLAKRGPKYNSWDLTFIIKNL